MELLCAIDLLEGQAVRLVRGEFGRRREFGDPLELVRRYTAGGARWLHVVDLDAARTGEPVNRDSVVAIAEKARAADVSVQAGGGIRRAEDATSLLSRGVDRVVLGTAAQRDPALVRTLCARYPGRVAVGIDHRGGGAEVAVAGWEQGSGTSLTAALGAVEGLPLAAVVVTSIERDGALQGPDLEALRVALGSTAHGVVASGGVRGTNDLAALAALEAGGRRLLGAIVGMALVEGLLDVEEAIAACEASG